MISITVCLINANKNGETTVLGQAFICNDGTSVENNKGNYDVYVGNKKDAANSDYSKILEKPQRKGRVDNYPRLSFNMWRLVIRALKSAFPEEK